MGWNFAPFLGGMAEQWNTINDQGRIAKAKRGELDYTHGLNLQELKEKHRLALIKDDKTAANRIAELIKTADLNKINQEDLAKLQSTLKENELKNEYSLKTDLETHKGTIEDAQDTTFKYWDGGVDNPKLKLQMEFSEGALKGGQTHLTQLAQVNAFNDESLKWLRDNNEEGFNDLLTTVDGMFKQAHNAATVPSDSGKGTVYKNWMKGLDKIDELTGIGERFDEFWNVNIRGKEINDWSQRDGKFYDDVAIILSEDGNEFSTEPLDFNQLAVNSGFNDKGHLLKSAEILAGWGVNSGSKDEKDLAKFVKSLRTNEISLATLHLSSEIDTLQELTFDGVGDMTSSFYKSVMEKRDEINHMLLSNSDPASKPDLIDLEDITALVSMTQGNDEIIESLGAIQKTSSTRVKKGSDWKYNDADRMAQHDAANKAKYSVNALKENIKESGTTVGVPSLTAELILRVRSTGEGMQKIFGNFKDMGAQGQLEDRNGKLDNIFSSMENFSFGGKNYNAVDALNYTGDDVQSKAAKNAAERHFLKFSIAYQLSMALQGGSGGRTISDQDVENILNALNMEGFMQAPELMTSALNEIERFLDGLIITSKYEQSTIKGYRASHHAKELFYAQGLPKTTAEFEKYMYDNVPTGQEPSKITSIGPNFSNFGQGVSMDDFTTNVHPVNGKNMIKIDRYETKNSGEQNILFFNNNDKFGEYSGQAVVIDSSTVDEYLDSYFTSMNIKPTMQRHWRDMFSPVDLKADLKELVNNTLTGKKVLLQIQ